jgi:hypothetical protein
MMRVRLPSELSAVAVAVMTVPLLRAQEAGPEFEQISSCFSGGPTYFEVAIAILFCYGHWRLLRWMIDAAACARRSRVLRHVWPLAMAALAVLLCAATARDREMPLVLLSITCPPLIPVGLAMSNFNLNWKIADPLATVLVWLASYGLLFLAGWLRDLKDPGPIRIA